MKRAQSECCPAPVAAQSRHAREVPLRPSILHLDTSEASWSPGTSCTVTACLRERVSWRRVRQHHSDLLPKCEVMQCSHVSLVVFSFRPRVQHEIKTKASPVSRVLPSVAPDCSILFMMRLQGKAACGRTCVSCRAFHLAVPVPSASRSPELFTWFAPFPVLMDVMYFFP